MLPPARARRPSQPTSLIISGRVVRDSSTTLGMTNAEMHSFFIEFRSILRMVSEKRAWYIFLVSSRKFLHFFDQFFYAKALREAQWPATPGRKTGAKNHSVIGILRRSDHILFQTTRRFVDH